MSSIFAPRYSVQIPIFEINEAGEGGFTLPEPTENSRAAYRRIYEVFLSFRGEDSRASFTSHLYASLQNAGINVFKDDESLPRGHRISNSLLRAIEQSEICVVVFSTNYGGSRWCMDELEKIMECHRTIGLVVLPVFYDVDPSEVRHQKGEFGKELEKLENRILKSDDKFIFQWEKENLRLNNLRRREALREAAGISGVVVLNSRNENESIKNIVENVTQLLDKTELFVADNPVGVEPRVQEIVQLLDQKPSNDVLLLGMWGMGGIGKTTIAKAIYNKIGRNFEGRSFLANIREVWRQDAGQVNLQEQLLFDINKETKTRIRNVESGKNILKKILSYKKVLLVLDDVNELDQLNALCGSDKWFAPGSRIIITTRDQDILRGRVDILYTMKGMDEGESIELFSWHAFKQASPRENFTQLSRNVIMYSGGLPLALEVLGCYLFDMKVAEWENVLEKLKRIPNHQIQKKLKISYDGLNDDTERDIFLDIACFFIGMDRNDVVHILNGCGLFAENGIRVLVERSLVIIDNKNKLQMHDLIRDMGREIIRANSLKVLEKRSRLWFHEDALDVLSKETGTKAIEGLALRLSTNNATCLSTKAFKKIVKLRLLQLAGVRLDGDFKYLSKDLRWLCWHGFPLKYIPTNFYQRNLISIELQNSNVQLVWKEAQRMEKLKILNLSHSHSLTQTPDFSKLPSLEKLELIDCPKLSKISHTIGHLNRILRINLQDCISLHNLPRSIYKLKTLKTLILSGCSKIDKLEEDLEQMESLTILVADKTAIKRMPFSIVRSKSIGYISLCGYEGFSRDVFPSIIWSWMSPTNSLSSCIQTSVGMSSLVSLDVTNSSSHHLSYILEDLPKLESLCIECDSKLQLTREAKNIIDALYATNSEDLESTTTTSEMSNIDASTLIKCNKHAHTSGSQKLVGCHLIQMGISCQVTDILRQSILQNKNTSDCSYVLPDDNYPEWLTFDCQGSSVIFKVPQVNGRNLKTMICHVHYSSPNDMKSTGLKNLLLINHTKTTIQVYKRDALLFCDNEKWQKVLSNIDPGNEVEIVVVYERKLIVKKSTVYLIYEAITELMEHYQTSNKNEIVSSDNENVYVVRTTSPEVCTQFGHGGHGKRARLLWPKRWPWCSYFIAMFNVKYVINLVTLLLSRVQKK
ncbi:LOW QUALITY PROTEIN: TMV resistance protein N-like [Cajanus cajan]|uniref:LOW QUALITY PROTEIN: TMV resistance protein N-like n=1 Tax=Cajanus cajan TaxID=3821 RepID=UPI00098D9F43|nr:LOW QUALITY PROTEIN: TMV resistance protein N-like [Cajanus cajan]